MDRSVGRFLKAIQLAVGGGNATPAALTAALATVGGSELPPYVASAVKLLATVQRNAVAAVTNPKAAVVEVAVPVGKRKKFGPLEQVARYTSCNQGWGNGSQVSDSPSAVGAAATVCVCFTKPEVSSGGGVCGGEWS